MLRKFYVDRYVTRAPIVLLGMQLLGLGIRRARRARGWTQSRLAWAAELSPSTISKLEGGKLQGMRLYTLARVVAALNIEIEFLDASTREALLARSADDLARANATWLRHDDRVPGA